MALAMGPVMALAMGPVMALAMGPVMALAMGQVYRCRPRRMRPRHCKGPPEGPGAWRAH